MAGLASLPGLDADPGSLESILGLLGEGAYAVGRDRRIIFWNQAAEKITGYPASDVLGSKCSDNILRHVTTEGVELCLGGCPLLATMQDGNTREAEVFLHHRNGHRVPVFVRAAPLHDKEGLIVGSVEIFSEQSEHSNLLSELELLRRENLTDHLTSLGNRRFLDVISAPRFASLTDPVRSFGLLVADIDRFKGVNDKYGHLNGDRALVMTARTILGAIRPQDAVVRFGGDEFIILCSNCGVELLAKVAERIRILVEHAWIELEPDKLLKVTLSIGGSLVSETDDLGSLIARADARMYDCKKAGGDCCLVGS